MVLRPTILRYKGKLRSIDRDKMTMINNRAKENQQNIYKETKAIPRIGFILVMGTCLTMGAPVVYVFYKNAVGSEYIHGESKRSKEEAV